MPPFTEMVYLVYSLCRRHVLAIFFTKFQASVIRRGDIMATCIRP